MTAGCMACDLAAGRLPLPGGRIHETRRWVVEHCIGPLGLGSLIVKPKRHVLHVADLDDDEAAELGPLLRATSRVATQLTGADQVYNCLWSHAGGVPGHIHYVVQPVTEAQLATYGTRGPALQMVMFDAGASESSHDVEEIATEARRLFAGLAGTLTP